MFPIGTNGYRLIVSSDARTWTDSRKRCAQVGGDIISIRSEEEQMSLIKIIEEKLPGKDAWLGANDITQEGDFDWSDGTTIDFHNWNYGEPNNWREEDCTHMAATFGYRWNDIPCSLKKGYICKIPGTFQFVTVISRTRTSALFKLAVPFALLSLEIFCKRSGYSVRSDKVRSKRNSPHIIIAIYR